MATLSSALNYALSGLSVSSAQSALLSRNVSFASDENYSRRTAEIITLPGGAASVGTYGRSMDKRLLDKLLEAAGSAAGRQVVFDALSRLGATIGDPEDDGSLSAMIGSMQNSLKIFEADPANNALGASAIEAARALADKLNGISAEIITVREDADQAMSGSVDRINTLLGQFKIVNDAVVRGSGTAADLGDSLDQRDSILKMLSDEIGIRVVTRSNNDISIYAEGGAVLFEGSPRSVSFAATANLHNGAPGNAVFVDGVPVTGPASAMPVSSGKLAALASVRDEAALVFQRQADEAAAALMRNFAESDQGDPPVGPDIAGLFIDDGGGALPVPGLTPPGLASRIAINPLADPTGGGNPMLLRDGGFGGSSYVYNGSGSAAFQARITALAQSFDTVTSFDPAAGLGTAASLKAFSIQSASWVEAQRQTAQLQASAAGALKARASESLLRVTGVNIDQEMAALLDLEKTYQASSKIISVVDSMLASLMEAVR